MIYFVSGHRNLTEKEFFDHYVPKIEKVMREDKSASFVVGDWEGCDSMFLNFIRHTYFIQPRIHVYYVNTPRVDLEELDNVNLYNKSTYDECDASMTRDSDFDIAWIRPGREDSHTALNIKRRFGL